MIKYKSYYISFIRKEFNWAKAGLVENWLNMDVKIMIKLGSNDNDPIRMKRVDQI